MFEHLKNVHFPQTGLLPSLSRLILCINSFLVEASNIVFILPGVLFDADVLSMTATGKLSNKK